MDMYKNPDLVIDWDDEEKDYYLNGEYSWKTPSNLAIVKYWGKYGKQLPRNASLSATLSTAHTETTLEFYHTVPEDEWITFYYDKKENGAFAQRVEKFFNSLEEIFPFIHQFDYIIHTKNSFPHSSGIASSASAMSALALCLCDIERQYFGTLSNESDYFKKASYIARLGSGSASRSLFPGWVEWGKHEANVDFSDVYGTRVADVHPSFRTMLDTILIASREPKSVSSSAGHKLMEDNSYAPARYQQATDRIPELIDALREGDWGTFGKIAENEALTLHALMMSSEDSYILMHPNTIVMINRIREYRAKTGQHVYFSLDAGPNIHMLYPKEIENDISKFIKNRLKELCDGKMIIYDHVGNGPVRFDRAKK